MHLPSRKGQALTPYPHPICISWFILKSSVKRKEVKHLQSIHIPSPSADIFWSHLSSGKDQPLTVYPRPIAVSWYILNSSPKRRAKHLRTIHVPSPSADIFSSHLSSRKGGQALTGYPHPISVSWYILKSPLKQKGQSTYTLSTTHLCQLIYSRAIPQGEGCHLLTFYPNSISVSWYILVISQAEGGQPLTDYPRPISISWHILKSSLKWKGSTTYVSFFNLVYAFIMGLNRSCYHQGGKYGRTENSEGLHVAEAFSQAKK